MRTVTTPVATTPDTDPTPAVTELPAGRPA